MKTITELRQEIVDRSLQAFHEGLFSGTSGNMSCYLREEDLMLITPTSVRYDVMRAEDIVVHAARRHGGRGTFEALERVADARGGV